MDRCISLVKVVERGCKGYKGGAVLALPGDKLKVERAIDPTGETPYYYVSNSNGKSWFAPNREIKIII